MLSGFGFKKDEKIGIKNETVTVNAKDFATTQGQSFENALLYKKECEKYHFGIHDQLLFVALGYTIKSEQSGLALGLFTILVIEGIFK